MAQDFKLNSTTFERITKADWDSDVANQGLDGYTPRLRWIRHTWQTNVLDVTEFNTLYAFEGQKVNLTTTNRDNRNGDFITYAGAICEKVNAQHNGPLFEGVQVDFLVRLTNIRNEIGVSETITLSESATVRVASRVSGSETVTISESVTVVRV